MGLRFNLRVYPTSSGFGVKVCRASWFCTFKDLGGFTISPNLPEGVRHPRSKRTVALRHWSLKQLEQEQNSSLDVYWFYGIFRNTSPRGQPANLPRSTSCLSPDERPQRILNIPSDFRPQCWCSMAWPLQAHSHVWSRFDWP